MVDNVEEKDYETFDHWSTEPVEVKQAYVPDDYDILDWQTKQKVERAGDPLWEYSLYTNSTDEVENI